MATFNFSADLDFGNYVADSHGEAQELFAIDAGYASWKDMVDQSIEVSGAANIEIREVMENGRFGSVLEYAS